MTRFRRYTSLAAAVTLLALGTPDRARAIGICCPNSTVPSHISLVGSVGSVPASGFGSFVVIVRDLANNPVPGVNVTIDLASAVDLSFCDDQLNPDLVVNCPAKTVRATSDAAGRASFTLLGGSNGAGNATTLLNGGRVYTNGWLVGSPTVSAFDLDGVNGLGATDLTAFLTDFASGQPWGRSDYDGSGALGAGDLALWLTAYASATQLASCSTSCP